MNKNIIIGLCMIFLMTGMAFAADLWVNSSAANCSNSYLRVNITQNTAWCNFTAPLTNDLMLSGDTLYVAAGDYNLKNSASTWDITGWTITSNTTIQCLPGVKLQRGEDYSTFSNLSGGLWYLNSSSNKDTNSARVYLSNGTRLFTYTNGTTGRDDFYSTPYKYASWQNTSYGPDRLFLKFSDTSFQPNNTNIVVVQNYGALKINDVTINSGSHLIIEGCGFDNFIYGIYVLNTTNIIIRNNTFRGSGTHSIYVNGQDVSSKGGMIEVYNNEFNGSNEKDWVKDDEKDYVEENDAVRSEDFYGAFYVYNNTFRKQGGSISLYADAYNEMNGSRIYNNTMSDNTGSAMEIEDYCYNSAWYNNRIFDCNYAGFSIAPGNARRSPYPCEIYNNLVFCNETFSQSTYGSAGYAWAIKAESRSSNNNTNWYIHHNTFGARGRSLNTINAAGSSPIVYSAWSNTTWLDNIFFAEEEYVLIRTGLATRDVYFDYNLYYGTPGITKLLQRWNNDSDIGYSNLASALAATDWTDSWDENSDESNPLFLSMTSNNESFLVPSIGSPACNMSSTGSYVGAIPCEEETNYAADTNNASVINNTLTNITSSALEEGIYFMYVECVDESDNIGESSTITVNITLTDTTSPIVNMISINHTTSNITPNVTFNYTDSESITAECEMYVNGINTASNETTNNNTNTKIISGEIGPGIYNVSISCTDLSGNEGNSSTISINVTEGPDITSPVVNMINSSFSTKNTTPSISFNYTDSASATASCTVYFNNTNKASNSSAINNTLTVLTSSEIITLGRYEVYVNCTDQTSNINKSNMINVTIIDSTSPVPVINFLSPSQGYNWIYTNWTNPGDIDFNHTELYRNGTFITNTSNNYYNFTGLTNNTDYVFTAITVDTTGNKGNNATLNQSTLTPTTPGNISVNQNIERIYFPVTVSLATFENWSMVYVNFTRFLQSRFNQSNIQAFNQTTNRPCYSITNNGGTSVTVTAKVNSYNSSYQIRVQNTSGTPIINLTGSYQNMINLTAGQKINISCYASYINAVINKTYNSTIVWNSTVI